MARKKKNKQANQFDELTKDIDIQQDQFQNFDQDSETDSNIDSVYDEDDQLDADTFDDVEDDILKEYQNDEDFAKQMTKKRRSKQYYVKGKDLIAEIRKYQQSRKTDPEGKGHISEQLGSMILKICTRFSLHPKFYGYSYRDEMVADAVTRCLTKSVNKINLDLTNCNPFSYFTQTALNSFRARINAQKRFMATKHRFREEVYNDYENDQGVERTKDNEDED